MTTKTQLLEKINIQKIKKAQFELMLNSPLTSDRQREELNTRIQIHAQNIKELNTQYWS